jgi:hypothetical protein
VAEESLVESFLQDAERILDTAASSSERNSPEYAICVSRTGSIRMLSDTTGWSLPALAAELGAAALYRVGRQGTVVRVEGWSYGRKCLLTRDSSGEWWSRRRPEPAYATLLMLDSGSGSQNDLGPRVRNS